MTTRLLSVAAKALRSTVFPQSSASRHISPVPLTKLGTLLLLGFVATPLRAVNPPLFSQPRGFYSAPFSLSLSVDPVDTSPTLRVRYTLDGKLPTPTVGQDFTTAIPISTTTVVRAIVYDSAAPATVSTSIGSSYLFPSHVIHQPVNIPTASDPNFANYPSYPRETYDVGNGKTAVHDYEMDPDVINHPAYSSLAIPALLAVPTVSLIADEAEMFGPDGFYDGETEHAGSMEILYPNDPNADQQANCGIDPHSSNRLKRALRLEFSSSFGVSKLTTSLLQTAPLGGNVVATKIDNLILRSGNNRSWARVWNPDATTYTEDEWFRESQSAMNGGVAAHGTFVHLYINGLYWGFYNITERPDESFAATYTGGKKGDHFSLKEDGRTKGDATRWNYLSTTLVAKDLTVPANYAEMQSYLDVGLFSDYLILAWYMGWNDWPHNNWWVDIRNDVPLPARYFTWDGEWSWDRGNPFDSSIKGEAPNGAWVHPAFRNGSTDNSFQAQFWRSLRVNNDFMALFADHVYEHTKTGGALSDQNARLRWNTLNLYVEDAVIAESARWGDAITPSTPRTRDVDWNREVTAIYNLMGGNVARFLAALRAQGIYPNIDPPAFAPTPGVVATGTAVSLTNPNAGGTIYYKTDGTDPRQPGGNLDPGAISYAGPVTVNAPTLIKARVLASAQWSALASGQFTPTTTNTPPIVSAVGPITLTLPAAISLFATASDDGLPGALTSNWSMASGAGTVSFAAPNQLNTTATFSAPGSYVLRLTASDGALTSSSDVPVFVYAAGTATVQTLDSFTLIDADSDHPIAGFEVMPDGIVVDLGTLPTRHLNIRANTTPATVGSVRFAFAGTSNFRTESGAPYALYGDNNGNYNAWTPATGSYTLKATPFTSGSAGGTAGVPLTVKFTVTDSSVADLAPPTVPTGLSADTFTTTSFTLHWAASSDNIGVTGYEIFRDGASQGIVNVTSLSLTGLAPNTTYAMTVRARDAAGNWSDASTALNVSTPASSVTQVVSVTLINADSDLPVAGYDPIPNGAVIARSSLPTTHLNLRVNTQPVAVGSVRMKLDSASVKVENVAPYAYFGDDSGNYRVGSISNATHTFTATPVGTDGITGTPLTISFKIQ